VAIRWYTDADRQDIRDAARGGAGPARAEAQVRAEAGDHARGEGRADRQFPGAHQRPADRPVPAKVGVRRLPNPAGAAGRPLVQLSAWSANPHTAALVRIRLAAS
jgi:hypothetical protein